LDLLPNDDQQQIADVTARFLETELPLTRLSQVRAPERLSARLASALADLGWFGLGLSEDQGGIGYGAAEESLVFREVGRKLGPPGILATALAARCAASAKAVELRDSLLAGRRIATWAECVSSATIADTVTGSFRLYDYEASISDLAIAVGPHGAALLEITGSSPESFPCIDEGVSLSAWSCRAASALCVVPGGELRSRAVLLSAAMLTGISEAARDEAVEYAKSRKQFGQAIGAFQAIKHACADLAIRSEAAWAQTCYASLTLENRSSDAELQVASAKIVAREAALMNSRSCIQIHGGYGFTAECFAHAMLKRTHVFDRMSGLIRRNLAVVASAPSEG
jgi:alkylation response protein AidB-like acyl-CoA dehydrogenase